MWACGVCTLHNAVSNSVCEVCGTPRGGGGAQAAQAQAQAQAQARVEQRREGSVDEDTAAAIAASMMWDSAGTGAGAETGGAGAGSGSGVGAPAPAEDDGMAALLQAMQGPLTPESLEQLFGIGPMVAQDALVDLSHELALAVAAVESGMTHHGQASGSTPEFVPVLLRMLAQTTTGGVESGLMDLSLIIVRVLNYMFQIGDTYVAKAFETDPSANALVHCLEQACAAGLRPEAELAKESVSALERLSRNQNGAAMRTHELVYAVLTFIRQCCPAPVPQESGLPGPSASASITEGMGFSATFAVMHHGTLTSAATPPTTSGISAATADPSDLSAAAAAADHDQDSGSGNAIMCAALPACMALLRHCTVPKSRSGPGAHGHYHAARYGYYAQYLANQESGATAPPPDNKTPLLLTTRDRHILCNATACVLRSTAYEAYQGAVSLLHHHLRELCGPITTTGSQSSGSSSGMDAHSAILCVRSHGPTVQCVRAFVPAAESTTKDLLRGLFANTSPLAMILSASPEVPPISARTFGTSLCVLLEAMRQPHFVENAMLLSPDRGLHATVVPTLLQAMAFLVNSNEDDAGPPQYTTALAVMHLLHNVFHVLDRVSRKLVARLSDAKGEQQSAHGQQQQQQQQQQQRPQCRRRQRRRPRTLAACYGGLINPWAAGDNNHMLQLILDAVQGTGSELTHAHFQMFATMNFQQYQHVSRANDNGKPPARLRIVSGGGDEDADSDSDYDGVDDDAALDPLAVTTSGIGGGGGLFDLQEDDVDKHDNTDASPDTEGPRGLPVVASLAPGFFHSPRPLASLLARTKDGLVVLSRRAAGGSDTPMRPLELSAARKLPTGEDHQHGQAPEDGSSGVRNVVVHLELGDGHFLAESHGMFFLVPRRALRWFPADVGEEDAANAAIAATSDASASNDGTNNKGGRSGRGSKPSFFMRLLSRSLASGDISTAIRLIANGRITANAVCDEADGSTPLHVVARTSSQWTIPETQSDMSSTAAGHAAAPAAVRGPSSRPSIRELIDALVESGADVNRRDGRGRTALHLACQNACTKTGAGNSGAASYYYSRARSNADDSDSALSTATEETIRALCVNGIDTELRDHRGRPACECAASASVRALLQSLITEASRSVVELPQHKPPGSHSAPAVAASGQAASAVGAGTTRTGHASKDPSAAAHTGATTSAVAERIDLRHLQSTLSQLVLPLLQCATSVSEGIVQRQNAAAVHDEADEAASAAARDEEEGNDALESSSLSGSATARGSSGSCTTHVSEVVDMLAATGGLTALRSVIPNLSPDSFRHAPLVLQFACLYWASRCLHHVQALDAVATSDVEHTDGAECKDDELRPERGEKEQQRRGTESHDAKAALYNDMDRTVSMAMSITKILLPRNVHAVLKQGAACAKTKTEVAARPAPPPLFSVWSGSGMRGKLNLVEQENPLLTAAEFTDCCLGYGGNVDLDEKRQRKHAPPVAATLQRYGAGHMAAPSAADAVANRAAIADGAAIEESASQAALVSLSVMSMGIWSDCLAALLELCPPRVRTALLRRGLENYALHLRVMGSPDMPEESTSTSSPRAQPQELNESVASAWPPQVRASDYAQVLERHVARLRHALQGGEKEEDEERKRKLEGIASALRDASRSQLSLDPVADSDCDRTAFGVDLRNALEQLAQLLCAVQEEEKLTEFEFRAHRFAEHIADLLLHPQHAQHSADATVSVTKQPHRAGPGRVAASNAIANAFQQVFHAHTKPAAVYWLMQRVYSSLTQKTALRLCFSDDILRRESGGRDAKRGSARGGNKRGSRKGGGRGRGSSSSSSGSNNNNNSAAQQRIALSGTSVIPLQLTFRRILEGHAATSMLGRSAEAADVPAAAADQHLLRCSVALQRSGRGGMHHHRAGMIGHKYRGHFGAASDEWGSAVQESSGSGKSARTIFLLAHPLLQPARVIEQVLQHVRNRDPRFDEVCTSCIGRFVVLDKASRGAAGRDSRLAPGVAGSANSAAARAAAQQHIGDGEGRAGASSWTEPSLICGYDSSRSVFLIRSRRGDHTEFCPLWQQHRLLEEEASVVLFFQWFGHHPFEDEWCSRFAAQEEDTVTGDEDGDGDDEGDGDGDDEDDNEREEREHSAMFLNAAERTRLYTRLVMRQWPPRATIPASSPTSATAANWSGKAEVGADDKAASLVASGDAKTAGSRVVPAWLFRDGQRVEARIHTSDGSFWGWTEASVVGNVAHSQPGTAPANVQVAVQLPNGESSVVPSTFIREPSSDPYELGHLVLCQWPHSGGVEYFARIDRRARAEEAKSKPSALASSSTASASATAPLSVAAPTASSQTSEYYAVVYDDGFEEVVHRSRIRTGPVREALIRRVGKGQAVESNNSAAAHASGRASLSSYGGGREKERMRRVWVHVQRPQSAELHEHLQRVERFGPQFHPWLAQSASTHAETNAAKIAAAAAATDGGRRHHQRYHEHGSDVASSISGSVDVQLAPFRKGLLSATVGASATSGGMGDGQLSSQGTDSRGNSKSGKKKRRRGSRRRRLGVPHEQPQDDDNTSAVCLSVPDAAIVEVNVHDPTLTNSSGAGDNASDGFGFRDPDGGQFRASPLDHARVQAGTRSGQRGDDAGHHSQADDSDIVALFAGSSPASTSGRTGRELPPQKQQLYVHPNARYRQQLQPHSAHTASRFEGGVGTTASGRWEPLGTSAVATAGTAAADAQAWPGFRGMLSQIATNLIRGASDQLENQSAELSQQQQQQQQQQWTASTAAGARFSPATEQPPGPPAMAAMPSDSSQSSRTVSLETAVMPTAELKRDFSALHDADQAMRSRSRLIDRRRLGEPVEGEEDGQADGDLGEGDLGEGDYPHEEGGEEAEYAVLGGAGRHASAAHQAAHAHEENLLRQQEEAVVRRMLEDARLNPDIWQENALLPKVCVYVRPSSSSPSSPSPLSADKPDEGGSRPRSFVALSGYNTIFKSLLESNTLPRPCFMPAGCESSFPAPFILSAPAAASAEGDAGSYYSNSARGRRDASDRDGAQAEVLVYPLYATVQIPDLVAASFGVAKSDNENDGAISRAAADGDSCAAGSSEPQSDAYEMEETLRVVDLARRLHDLCESLPSPMSPSLAVTESDAYVQSSTPEIWWNDSLREVLSRQFHEAMVVVSDALPAWVERCVERAPFMLSLPERMHMLRCTAFGVSRAVCWFSNISPPFRPTQGLVTAYIPEGAMPTDPASGEAIAPALGSAAAAVPARPSDSTAVGEQGGVEDAEKEAVSTAATPVCDAPTFFSSSAASASMSVSPSRPVGSSMPHATSARDSVFGSLQREVIEFDIPEAVLGATVSATGDMHPTTADATGPIAASASGVGDGLPSSTDLASLSHQVQEWVSTMEPFDFFLAYAQDVMKTCVRSRFILEFRFANQAGYGSGVTASFFSLLAGVLSSRLLNFQVPLWYDDTVSVGMVGAVPAAQHVWQTRAQQPQQQPKREGVGEVELRAPIKMMLDTLQSTSVNQPVHTVRGLFPMPLADAHPAKQRVCDRFRLLGQLAGRAFMDGYILPLPLSEEFVRLALFTHPMEQRALFVQAARMYGAAGNMLLELARARDNAALTSDPGADDPAWDTVMVTTGVGAGRTDMSVRAFLESATLAFEDPVTGAALPPRHVRDGEEAKKKTEEAGVPAESAEEDEVVDVGSFVAYVDAVRDMWSRGIHDQLVAFCNGVDDVFPARKLRLLTPLEVLETVTGEADSEWSIEALRACVVPGNGFTARSDAFVHLLQLLHDGLTADQKREFIRFVTGCPALPRGGLAALSPPLEVCRRQPATSLMHRLSSHGQTPSTEAAELARAVDGMDSSESLPFARTCTNTLHLPPYESKEHLRERLLFAMRGCGNVIDRD